MSLRVVALTSLAAVAFAVPAHAARLSIASDDCDSPPLSSVIGQTYLTGEASRDGFVTIPGGGIATQGCANVFNDPAFNPDGSESVFIDSLTLSMAFTSPFTGGFFLTDLENGEFKQTAGVDFGGQFDELQVVPTAGNPLLYSLIFSTSGRAVEFTENFFDLAIRVFNCPPASTGLCADFPQSTVFGVTSVTQVPEPASFVLLATGLAFVWRAARRRQDG